MCVCVWVCEHVHNESHVAPRHDAPNFRITEVRDAHLALTTMRAREGVAYVCAAAQCAKLSYHRSARRTWADAKKQLKREIKEAGALEAHPHARTRGQRCVSALQIPRFGVRWPHP